ncbi:CU044_2847 family protein [Micromonospora sp. NPDC049051]|uniref:CU044_2847 family protein n=1 Tax=Micromonospora sp. NPDC049051 TaxID=3364264 RepID=UPI0037184A56
MAVTLVPFDLDGETVLVEVESLPGSRPTGVGRGVERVQDLFAQAESVVGRLAEAAIKAGRSVAVKSARPTQIEIQIGVKFSAQGHVIIARGSGEASLAVKVIYGIGESEQGEEQSSDSKELGGE